MLEDLLKMTEPQQAKFAALQDQLSAKLECFYFLGMLRCKFLILDVLLGLVLKLGDSPLDFVGQRRPFLRTAE